MQLMHVLCRLQYHTLNINVFHTSAYRHSLISGFVIPDKESAHLIGQVTLRDRPHLLTLSSRVLSVLHALARLL